MLYVLGECVTPHYPGNSLSRHDATCGSIDGVPLAGAGSLAVSPTIYTPNVPWAGAAQFSGRGALAAVLARTTASSATLAGAGAMVASATTTTTTPHVATLAGAGTFVANGGFRLDTTNLAAGLATAAFTPVAPFIDYFMSRTNDGTALTSGSVLSTYCIRTLNAAAAENNGMGIQIDFGRNVRLGKMSLSKYGTTQNVFFDWNIQAFIGGVWTDTMTAVANDSSTYTTYQDLFPNTSGIFMAQLWRFRVANWSASSTNNMYVGEVRAYEWVG